MRALTLTLSHGARELISLLARKRERAWRNMNMIIHDTEGEIQIGDTFRTPKFRKGNCRGNHRN